MTSSTPTSTSTSATGTVKLCFNSNCKRALEQPRNGWRRRSGDFAELCDLCASAYEDGKFCEAFHLNASGWRCCETCGKQIHCGCIVSFHMFVLLDAGGIECLTCTKKSFILTPNPAWPPSSLFLPSQPERIQELAKSWNPIAGSGPVPWQQAPSLFNGSIYSELQSKAPSEFDPSGGISRLRHGDRVSASSFECNKNEDSFGRLISGSLNNGAFEVPENGIAALECDDRSKTRLSGPQHTNVATVSSSRSEENNHAKISLPSRPLTHLASVGKQTGSHNGLETSLGAQGRTRKARGDGRGRSHLLPRYWPRITDQELQQICGDSKFIITPLFEKMLTASDAGRMGRLVLPKKCAETYLPAISHPEGVPLKVQDLKGNEWVFQFRFWPNNNSRMYVLEGVTPCIQSMQLQAGDIVTFSRIEPDGKLVFGGRKTSTAPPLDQGNEAVLTGAAVSPNMENYTKICKPDENDSVSIRGAMDKSVHVAKERFEAKSSVCIKRKNSVLSSKSKRMRIENGDMLRLKLTRKQAQGLIRPAPTAISKVIVIEGCEFEEYDELDAPIIGRPTIPTSDDTGEKIQWIQCEDCHKWRKIPASAILPSRWTCSQNFWNPERSVCSAAQELTAEQLGGLLPSVSKAGFRKIRSPKEEVAFGEPSEGLDTLANLAIGEEGASLQATTRHPRHKHGCTCIVCMQPPSGKGPKHKQSCDCMVCKSVKRRFRTLMTNREKKHLVKEIETADQKLGQDIDINPCSEVGDYFLKPESASHEDCKDSKARESPTSPINATRIDLNINPVREDRLPLITGSESILHLLQDVSSCSALRRVHEMSNAKTQSEIDADFLKALCEDTIASASTT